jgi:hypothetical protein
MAIRRAQDSGPASVSTTPSIRARDSLQVQLPPFLAGAFLDIERVFRATNPGSRRCDFVEALTAESASGDGSGNDSGMIDVGRDVRAHTATVTSRSDDESGVLDSDVAHEDIAHELPGDNTTSRELLQARWTLHRVHLFIESLDAEAQAWCTPSPRHIVRSMRMILALEHEVKLRIDQLLLWLDHRRAWSLLGFADAAEFGVKVLDESASTTRNRLGLARAGTFGNIASRRGVGTGVASTTCAPGATDVPKKTR